MPNVALVLSGAVSLGTFEAGVLDELLYTLARLNEHRSPEDPFRIDVITGASAGAMTAALLARAVMVDPDDRRFLRNAWVDEIDIGPMLDDIPDNALLSKTPIAGIAARYLSTPTARRPSSVAPERLLMRFMVTNMSGVDFRLERGKRPGGPSDDFVSTFHAEARDFVVTSDNVLDDGLWGAIRETALASGNFPFAFAPHELPSEPAVWPGNAMEPFPDGFTYIDGGLFNNEPLGQAITLARKLDGTPDRPGIAPDRIFLMVDANLNGSRHDPSFRASSPLPATFARTLNVLLGESSALDWLAARRVNNESDWRDDLFELLAGLVRDTTVDDADALLARLEDAADRIVDRKRAIFPDRYPPDYRERAVERTALQFGEHATELGEARRKIFATLAFLVNSVAGLDKKDRLNLFVIYTTPEASAGDELRAFAGFFEHAWRLHDYTAGRRTANAELPWVLEGGTEPYPRESGVDYDFAVDLEGVTLANTPRATRERLRDATVAKAEMLARDVAFGPRWLHWATGWLTRAAVRKAVRAKLDGLLDL